MRSCGRSSGVAARCPRRRIDRGVPGGAGPTIVTRRGYAVQQLRDRGATKGPPSR
jgi:hypothetical protein